MSPTKTDKKKAARKKPTTPRATAHSMHREVFDWLTSMQRSSDAGFREINRKLDLLLSSNSLLQELEAKKEEQGKWKEGDRVFFKPDPNCPSAPTCIGSVVRVLPREDWSKKQRIYVQWSDEDPGYHWSEDLRLATPEEIESSAYGEREGLEEGDQCVANEEERAEAFAMMAAAGIFRTTYGEGPSPIGSGLSWKVDKATDWPLRENIVEPLGSKMTWAVFKKLLIKTIEKLRSAREEEEAKKPIRFGTVVRVNIPGWEENDAIVHFQRAGDKKWKVINQHGGEDFFSRSSFTILNN